MQAGHYPRWFNKIASDNQLTTILESNPYPRWFTWLGLAFVTLVCIYSFWEWYMIRVLNDKQMISDYKVVYKLPVIYATSALHLALACLPIISLFVLATKKNTHLYRLIAFTSIIVAAVIGKLLN